MVWTGSTFVAVGAVMRAESDGDVGVAAIWVSPDGLTWRRRELPLDAGATSSLSLVAVGPTGVMAGGEMASKGSYDALVLASGDGEEWHAIELDGLTGDEDETVSAIAATAAQWLIKGRVAPPKCRVSGCVTREELVLTSADAASWTGADGGRSAPDPFGTIDGDFVGVLEHDADQNSFAFYRSHDGVAWTPYADPLAFPPETTLGGFAVAGGRVIVGAYAWDGSPRAYAFVK
jgi:hypothetical protein